MDGWMDGWMDIEVSNTVTVVLREGHGRREVKGIMGI